MEEEGDRHALGGGMEADEPASPREPPSPPPPPSPPSPAAPDTPGPPQSEQPSEAYARQLLLEEWRPPGGTLELPPRLTWRLLFLRRPLYRNLLRSPNPEGAGRCGTRRCTPTDRRPVSAFRRARFTRTVCLIFLSAPSCLFPGLFLCFSTSFPVSSVIVPLSGSLRLSLPTPHCPLSLSMSYVPVCLSRCLSALPCMSTSLSLPPSLPAFLFLSLGAACFVPLSLSHQDALLLLPSFFTAPPLPPRDILRTLPGP